MDRSTSTVIFSVSVSICVSVRVNKCLEIERKGTDQIVNESIPVPPSSYIVYAYDLEENVLPHRIPADSPSPEIIINTPCKSLECILISFTYQISQILNPTQLQNS